MLRYALYLSITAANFNCAYPAKAQNRMALVIGQSAYRSVPPLLNPMNDARAVSEARAVCGPSWHPHLSKACFLCRPAAIGPRLWKSHSVADLILRARGYEQCRSLRFCGRAYITECPGWVARRSLASGKVPAASPSIFAIGNDGSLAAFDVKGFPVDCQSLHQGIYLRFTLLSSLRNAWAGLLAGGNACRQDV